MFYSHCFLSRKGPLGAIWVAAYCFKKLKKAQVTQTDISSSVDKILQDEFDVVTYRVLAYLLLGIVRIFSKKVEYLFSDCNKALLKIKEFVISNKDMGLVETLRAPYFSITLPKRFELDAFDLEILEDASEHNLLPHEDITLKDGIGKSGEIVPSSLAEDIFSMGYTQIEDILSSHLIDFDIEVGTSSSNLEASIKKLQGSSSSLHESQDLEMFTAVEEEPPDPVKLFGEGHPNKGKHTTTRVLEVVCSAEMLAESSMLELQDNSICQEACLDLEIFGEVEEEPENSSKTFGKNHQTDEQMIKVPDMAQSENENLQVIKEDNFSGIETSVEKLRDAQEECGDMEIFHLAESSAHGVAFDKEHQSDSEQKNLLEVEGHSEHTSPPIEEHQCGESTILYEMLSQGNRTHEVFMEDHLLSVTLDTTPQSKFQDAAGVNAPEYLVIPTPAAKEGARSRKRKCIVDDVIVFPNNVIKQYIEDPSNLVCKRKKIPHTVLAAWRAHQISSLPQCFLEPLIPCTSLELRSLFCQKKLKIPESVDTEKLPEKFMSECPAADRPLETMETLEKLDESRPCSNGKMIETMKSLEQLNVSATVSKPIETVEPPEKLVMPESPTAGGSLEQMPIAPETPVLQTVGKLIETVEPPEKLDTPESPTAGRSLEKISIAPETPILQTKSLRSFESPEISNLDGVTLESGRAQRESSPSRKQELDLSLMNEEINLSEGHNQDQYGWSERTRVVVRCLCRSFLNQKKRNEDEVVNLQQLLDGRTKKESARFFYEILVLRSRGYVHVQQENAYGNILIYKASQWEQTFGADCAEIAKLDHPFCAAILSPVK